MERIVGRARPSKRSSMACTSCRQVKLRCDATQCFPAPCTRCQKHRMSCKFDSKFKRKPVRGSLEKAMEENERLRRLVNNSETTPVESDLDARLLGQNVLPPLQKDQEPPLLNSFTWELPEPQVLEEVRLDGLIARDLFEHFARHYFHHLPILDLTKSIDSIRIVSPLLFWTIIVIASRKHPLHGDLSRVLKDPFLRILANTMIRSVRSIYTIQALLLLCLWPFPVETQLDDPSWEYCGIAVAASLKMGLEDSPVNWGQPVRPSPDEHAWRLKTWLGCFVVSTNLAACLSLPPPMAPVASLMPRVRDSIRSGLPGDFLALLEIQAYSIRATSLLNDQVSSTAQRSFIELLDSDLDAVEGRMPTDVYASLQISIVAARLRLYSLPLLSRTSHKTANESPDTLTKATWYKGFHVAMQLVDTLSGWTQPSREGNCESTTESFVTHFPKQYLSALVMAGMYFINLLVIDTNISTHDKIIARNHIKKAYETLTAQSTEERDEPYRAGKAIEFLSRHIEAQGVSLELRQPGEGNRPLSIINSGMRMVGHFRSQLGSQESNVPDDLPAGVSGLPALEDFTDLPPFGDDLFEWNSWFAGMDNIGTLFQMPATTP